METNKIKISVLIVTFLMMTTTCFAGVRINGIGIDYNTIQAAVTNAIDGDVLIVSTGFYGETIHVYGRNITIDGQYDVDYITKLPSGCTIIDPPLSSGSCIDITGSVVELIDLEITGTIVSGGDNGGGMDIRYDSVVTARQCSIHNNSVIFSSGGGAFVDNSSLTLIDTPVYNNSVGTRGGGIYAHSGQIILDGNSPVSANTAGVGGGGIYLFDDSRCDLIHASVNIENNSAPEGGGIAVRDSELFIGNNADVFGNTAATRGGGILLEKGSSVTVYGSGTYIGWYPPAHMPNSVTNGSGGGIYAADSTVVISNMARLVSNFASKAGGGIYLTNSSALVYFAEIGHPEINATNYAGNDGGGICMLDSSLIVANNSKIQKNYAHDGGGIYAYNSNIGIYDSIIGNQDHTFANRAFAGGGLFCINSTFRCDNSQIVGNFAEIGGGAAFGYTSDVYIVNSSINENSAIGWLGGGGIVAEGTIGPFILDNTEVVGNITSNAAGGIYWMSSETLVVRNGSRICDNVASNGVGGVLSLVFSGSPGNLLFQDSEISGNSTLGMVGGICAYTGGKVTIVDCSVNNNKGGTNNSCGGILMLGGSLDIIASNSNCSVSSNSAGYGGGIVAAFTTKLSISALPGKSCNIDGNSAQEQGGGFYCIGGVTATISGNVSIDNNNAYNGGGIFTTNSCAFSLFPVNGVAPSLKNNTATLLGGGLSYWGPDSVIYMTNVVIQGNNALLGGGAILYSDTDLRAINCKFLDNKAFMGGAIFTSDSKITIDSDFNIAPPSILPPTIFQGNSASNIGGGIVANGYVEMYIANAMFVSNSALFGYGGMAIAYSTGKLVNVIVADNYGGGIADGLGIGGNNLIELQQCTVANNYSNGIYQGVYYTPAHLQNCIVWGHLGEQVSTNVTAEFCDIQGGFSGPFNITNDPLFINPAALDYQISDISESIDKGRTLGSVTNDCIGEPRPYGVGWDMGAYEFIPEPAGIWIIGLLATRCILKIRRRA